MAGHRVRVKKEMDMENQCKLGKILGGKNNKRDIDHNKTQHVWCVIIQHLLSIEQKCFIPM